MSARTRNLIIAASVVLALVFAWVFRTIFLYCATAMLLALIGRPVMRFLESLRFRRFRLPDSLCALLTLLLMLSVVLLLFATLVPVMATQASALASINTEQLRFSLSAPLDYLYSLMERYDLVQQEAEITAYVQQQAISFLSEVQIGAILSAAGNFAGNLAVALFSTFFIAFFLLKEESLTPRIFFSLTPDGKEDKVKNILEITSLLLRRYFVGILLQLTIVGTLIASGLSIVGVKNAIFIGIFTGLLNVVPYLGPILGALLGLGLTILGSLGIPFYPEMTLLLSKVAGVYLFTQLVDNVLLQPLIYSKSVKAHPLEIFLVIMIAGSLAGIPGMIFGVPVYTILRVVAREFLGEFEVIRSLTRHT